MKQAVSAVIVIDIRLGEHPLDAIRRMMIAGTVFTIHPPQGNSPIVIEFEKGEQK